jgi:hypothetical protein
MKKTIITILSLSAIIFLGYFLFWLYFDYNNEPVLLDQSNNQELVSTFNEEKDFISEMDVNDVVDDIDDRNKVVLPRIEKNLEMEELIDNVIEEEPEKKNILLQVPFIAQAPLGNWSDPRQQDACEEAGVLMAMAWVNSDREPSLLEAEKQIIELADWQQEKYGEHRDLHIEEVASLLFGEYFGYDKVEVREISAADDLITILEQGNIILIPSNGQALKNPYFTAPGPERHLLAIIGYEYETETFITNDPGTRQGRNFKYPKERLFEAIRVYPSGYHQPIVSQEKLILIVSK